MSLPRRSRPFGDLEATLMDLLWNAERPLSVREAMEGLRPRARARLHHRHDGAGQPAPQALAAQAARRTGVALRARAHPPGLHRAAHARGAHRERRPRRACWPASSRRSTRRTPRPSPRRCVRSPRRGTARRAGGRLADGDGRGTARRAVLRPRRETRRRRVRRRRVAVVTVGGALIVYAVVGFAGPVGFRRAAWPLRAPRLGAAAMVAAAWSVPVALVLAGVTVFLPASGLTIDVAHLIGACLGRLRAAYGTPAGAGIATAGQVLTAGMLLRGAWTGVRVVRRRRAERRRHRLLVRWAGAHVPELPRGRARAGRARPPTRWGDRSGPSSSPGGSSTCSAGRSCRRCSPTSTRTSRRATTGC